MCTCGVVSGPVYPGIEELFAAENDATTFDRLLRSDPLLWDMQHPVSGWTPMMLAAQRGYLATVNFLLEQGCDTSQFTCRWGSALSVASHFGHADIITCLIRRGGADIEFSCGIVGPPLLVAAKRGYMACVTTLLDHGVNIDATDIIGRTALSYAASRGFENIVRTLLDRGADVRVRDQGGLTAVGRALQTLNARCADIIADKERERLRVSLLCKARLIDTDQVVLSSPTPLLTVTPLLGSARRTRLAVQQQRHALVSSCGRARLATNPSAPLPTLVIHGPKRKPGGRKVHEVLVFALQSLAPDLFEELCDLLV